MQRRQVICELKERCLGCAPPAMQAWREWDFQTTSVCSLRVPIMFWERLFSCARNCRKAVRKDSAFRGDRHGHCDGCGGSILSPKGSPVEAAGCVRKCHRPSQAESRSGWENSQSKGRANHSWEVCGKALPSDSCESGTALLPPNPRQAVCLQIHNPQRLTPAAKPGRPALCEQMSAQQHLSKQKQEAGVPPEHSRALLLSTSCSYLSLCPPEFSPMHLNYFPKITVNQC